MLFYWLLREIGLWSVHTISFRGAHHIWSPFLEERTYYSEGEILWSPVLSMNIMIKIDCMYRIKNWNRSELSWYYSCWRFFHWVCSLYCSSSWDVLYKKWMKASHYNYRKWCVKDLWTIILSRVKMKYLWNLLLYMTRSPLQAPPSYPPAWLQNVCSRFYYLWILMFQFVIRH